MEETLLALALAPLTEAIAAAQKDQTSDISVALKNINTIVDGKGAAHKTHFDNIATRVESEFNGVFPALKILLEIASNPLSVKLDDLVKKGSAIRVQDGKAATSLAQQGTGSRRALFWSMLQVHNELVREKEVREVKLRALKALLKKEKDAAEKAKLEAQIASIEAGGPLPTDDEDPALPGYLLLIDEPENALHPIAARAAQRHLYRLASQADWQVILTTHSPYFVNPFADHTTIVRMDRPIGDDGSASSPLTYRSDYIEFEADDKERLKALQAIDPSFCEIFFGSYPILVEGDTEHAAMIAAIVEKSHSLQDKVTIVRARGKAILPAIIAVLTHFKIDFGIVHDCDPPFRSDGAANGMWTENSKIREGVIAARNAGVKVVHRVSVIDFERHLGGFGETKDKPIACYRFVATDESACKLVTDLLEGIVSAKTQDPFDYDGDYDVALREKAAEWADLNGESTNVRFCGKPE